MLFQATYREGNFEQRNYATALVLPAPGERPVLRLGLNDATFLLSFLAAQPDWQDRLIHADPHVDDEEIVRSFGIDPDAVCRASVGAWDSGVFLAPDGGGYAYFLVEPNGEVSVISRSDRLLAVAFHFACKREANAIHLASRLGKVPPAPDEPV